VPATPQLEIIPLGGLGEFGMNLMLYRWGDDCLIVDAGMMFPGDYLPGVDFVLPDLSFLDAAGHLLGVVLTHAHEDHIGAVPYLLDRHDVPVWGSRYTIEVLRQRFAQRETETTPDFRFLPPSPESVRIGPFGVEAVPVAHSIPQSRLIVLDTPVGRVIHTGDLRLDPAPPDGEGTDHDRLIELGRQGVLALLSDSTNADRPGTTPGEAVVHRGLDDVLEHATGRVVLTTFASNVQRVAGLGRLAERHGRRRSASPATGSPNSRAIRCWRSPADRRASRFPRCRGSPPARTATLHSNREIPWSIRPASSPATRNASDGCSTASCARGHRSSPQTTPPSTCPATPARETCSNYSNG